jgi:hypothetical protein
MVPAFRVHVGFYESLTVPRLDYSLLCMNQADINDVVEFVVPGGDSEGDSVYRIGFVDNDKRVYPLCLRRDSESVNGAQKEGADTCLFVNDDCNSWSLHEINVTGVVDEVTYTQRVVEDRISNPHGEHSEDVWLLSTQKLDEMGRRIQLPMSDGAH